MSFPNMKQFAALKEKVGELEARIQGLEGYVPPGTPEPEVVPSIEDTLPLNELLGDKIAGLLVGKGFASVDLVAAASDEELNAITGIGAATVRTIREALEGPEEA